MPFQCPSSLPAHIYNQTTFGTSGKSGFLGVESTDTFVLAWGALPDVPWYKWFPFDDPGESLRFWRIPLVPTDVFGPKLADKPSRLIQYILSLRLKINLSRSLSIGFNTDVLLGPLAVFAAFDLPCSIMVSTSSTIHCNVSGYCRVLYMQASQSSQNTSFWCYALGVGVAVSIMGDGQQRQQKTMQNQQVNFDKRVPTKEVQNDVPMAHIWTESCSQYM